MEISKISTTVRNVQGWYEKSMVRNVYGTNSLWYEKSGNLLIDWKWVNIWQR